MIAHIQYSSNFSFHHIFAIGFIIFSFVLGELAHLDQVTSNGATFGREGCSPVGQISLCCQWLQVPDGGKLHPTGTREMEKGQS